MAAPSFLKSIQPCNKTGGWQIEPPCSELNADALQQWVDRRRRQRASEVSYPLDIKQENAIQITLQLADGNSIPHAAMQTEEWSGLYYLDKRIGY